MNNLKKTLPLNTLQILDVIDKKGSFQAASQYFNRSISSLSYQVQKLEDELDLLLLDRSGHRAKFTEIGKILLENGRPLLDSSDSLIKLMKQTSQGWELSFSIGYDAIVNVDVVFELTHKLSQHSTSVLRLKEEVLAGGWESLESGEIDILFSTLPERPLPQHIQTMHIYSDTMVWAANPDYANRLNLNNNRKWTDATLVVIPDTAKTYAKESRNLDAHQSKRFYAANINNKKQAIVASIGIGTLPKCMIEQEDLVNLGTSKSVDIYAAWSRSNMGKTKALALQALRNLANKDLFST